jgi:hypothetical protein
MTTITRIVQSTISTSNPLAPGLTGLSEVFPLQSTRHRHIREIEEHGDAV